MTFPSFTTGEVLTAADMNAVGRWLVKSQTVGSAVSSVQVTGAFSSNYDVYQVVWSGGTASTTADVWLQLGAATTNYAHQFLFGSYGNTASANGATGGTRFTVVGGASTSIATLDATILSPFQSVFTTITSIMNSGSGAGVFTGQHRTAASYTDFTIGPSSGTITGGTIRVYGYRN
jgi:hypothetical protein